MNTEIVEQTRRYSIFVIFFLLVSCSLEALVVQSQTNTHYNVLFIAVDDMNARVSFMGWPEVKTPNLERLVSRGMVFTHAYCQFPLCSPSRTSIMLGWRPDKTGIVDNNVRPSSILGSGVVYLPEYFKQYGYHTERYGKIMHASFENDITWDYAEPVEKSGGDLSSDSKTPFASTTRSYNNVNWWINNVSESSGEDGAMAHHLVARLKQQPLTQPFFYGLGLIKTHNPFTPNLKYWNMNGDPSVQELLPVDANKTITDLKGNGSKNIIIPSTPAGDRDDDPAIAFTGQDILSTYEWKETIHAYEGEAAQMDSQLGVVLDELDRQNLWANTVVVFWSDHGQHLGEHEGLWAKQTLFEESLQVPLIICVPGKKAGVCSRLIELADLYPALAELCGLPKPKGMEGLSFAPLLDNPTFEWKKAVFSQVKRTSVMGRSVTTEQYQYNSWGTAGEELYDHYKDPHEYTNLITNPQYAIVLEDMRKILADGWTKSLPPVYKIKTFYKDADTDGYGNFGDSIHAYAQQKGYVSNYSDCNDNNANIHPEAKEICDGIDNDCNGQIDENKPLAEITPLGSLNICTTDSVVLQANSGLGFTYKWKKEGTMILNATKRAYTVTNTGTYKVVVIDSGGCSKTSTGVLVTNSCNSIAINSIASAALLDNLSLYPNPSKGNITLRYKSNTAGRISFKIYEATGKLVFDMSKEPVTKGNNIKKLNLSFEAGVYYLEVNNNGVRISKSFIIIK
jgi:iduronate 2-sulfatase